MTDLNQAKENPENQDNKSNSDSNNEQVENLSDRDIKWRAQYKVTKNELETTIAKHKMETEKLKETLTGEVTKMSETNAKLREQVLETEIKAAAIAAGLKDLELTKLLDRSQIKVNEDGSIVGVAEAIASYKERKPEYFDAAKMSNSSSNHEAPEQKGEQKVSAWDLSQEDWNKRNNVSYF